MFGAALAVLLLPGFAFPSARPQLATAVPAAQALARCSARSAYSADCSANRDEQAAPNSKLYSSSRDQWLPGAAPARPAETVTVARHFVASTDALTVPSALDPVAPAVVPAVVPSTQRFTARPHAFFDRKNTIGFAVHGAIRAADAAQTCALLNKPGRRESWLPMNSCGAIVGYSMSMIPAQIGSSYLLHRSGHHTLERWLPYFWAAPSAAGVAVSLRAW